MGLLDNGYISKTPSKLSKTKIVILVFVVLLVFLAAFYMVTRPISSIYRFNSGLNLSFNLNKWRLIPNSTNGDTLESNDQKISIFLTSTRPEDESQTLTDIVDSRIALLDKQNIEVRKESLKIHDLDFYKIEYKDKGDENIKPDESSVSFVTLYNNIYTTIQVFYKTGSDLTGALDVITTTKSN